MVEVFLDLDGVLVDFVGGACKLHNVVNPYLKPENHGKYDMDKLINLKANQFWESMNYNFWANLDWLPDGQMLIKTILKYVSEEQVTILTSPISQPGCVDGKIHWIKTHLPMWKRSFFIGPPKHKISGPGKLLIDDHDVNIDKWLCHKNGKPTGGHAIQVPRVMNRWHKLAAVAVGYVDKSLETYFANDHNRTG